MKKVQKRMLEILDSLPPDCFDNKSSTEIAFFLGRRYVEIYGEDETTLKPGTKNEHFKVEDFPETSIKI